MCWLLFLTCCCVLLRQIGKLTRAQTSAVRIHRELAGAMASLASLHVVSVPAKGKRRELQGLAAMGLGIGLVVDGSFR